VAGYFWQVIESENMNDFMNTVGGKPFWRAGGFVYETATGNFIRCVRGIPIGRELWMQGDGRSGEPKNDNIKGGRYPFQEEYKAERLGKTDEESDVLWSTGKWLASHHDIANRPYEACSYGIGQAVKVGELGGFVDPDEHEEAMGSSDPIGYGIEIDPLYKLGGPDASFIATTGRGEKDLLPLESRARSVKICQHLKYRLDCNYRHVVDAVVHRCEMKAIGMAEGNKDGAASAGRMLVRAGLRTATLVRLDIARWEAKSRSRKLLSRMNHL
jgi:hypothetical protein